MIKRYFKDPIDYVFNLIALLSIIVLFFSILKYFVVDDYFKFFYLKYLIVFLIFTFLIFLLRIFLSKDAKTYFSILIFSTLIGLIIIEILFTLNSRVQVNGIEIRAQQAKKLGLPFDKRSKYEFYKDFLKSEKNAMPSIPPNDFFVNYKDFKSKDSMYALSGVSNSPTVLCNEGGKTAVYISDRYGFRNNDKVWENDTVDYVLLGDSLAQGACVDDADTIHERIIFYTKKKFLNLGFQGHGPLMQLASIKEYAKFKKPKKIIWFYSETNDIDNLIYEYQWDVFKNYLKEKDYTQKLIKNQSNLDNDHKKMVSLIYADKQTGDRQKRKSNNDIFFTIKGILKLYHLREFVSFFIPRKFSLTLQYYSPLNTFEIYSQVLDEAINTVNMWGGEIYFVYYPHAARYFSHVVHPYPLRKYDYMLDLAKQKNIKIIDLRKNVFENHPDKKSLYPLRISGHPNEKGYDLVAKHISDILMEK